MRKRPRQAKSGAESGSPRKKPEPPGDFAAVGTQSAATRAERSRSADAGSPFDFQAAEEEPSPPPVDKKQGPRRPDAPADKREAGPKRER